MIASADCRCHGAECREMDERAPNVRVAAILIDMARIWERMAIEVEQSEAPVARAGVSTPHIRVIASQEATNGANSNSRNDR